MTPNSPGGPARVDFLLRQQHSLANEATKVAGQLHELHGDNKQRYQEIAKLSSLLDGIKARASLGSSMHWVRVDKTC